LLDVRTLENLGGARGYGNQAFQRRPVVALALLVLIDSRGDLGLPFLQLARFCVVLTLRNSPIASIGYASLNSGMTSIWVISIDTESMIGM
jgi:hypothetical protein